MDKGLPKRFKGPVHTACHEHALWQVEYASVVVQRSQTDMACADGHSRLNKTRDIALHASGIVVLYFRHVSVQSLPADEDQSGHTQCRSWNPARRLTHHVLSGFYFYRCIWPGTVEACVEDSLIPCTHVGSSPSSA